MEVGLRNSERGKIWLETVLGIVFFFVLSYLSQFFFARIDLTEEKRHTLTPTTIDLVRNLDDVVYLKIFLEGEFPADYQRLRQAVKEKLDEMRAYAGDNIQYEFINPSESPDRKSREAMYGELVEKGLMYTALQIRAKDGLQEKIIFPGALIAYKDREIPVQLLQNTQRASDAELINRTINNLEYKLVSAIYQVKNPVRKRVAFLEGNGMLRPIQTRDLQKELSRYYDVDVVELGGQLNALSRNGAGQGRRENRYDAIVIAKPTEPFSEQDKYIIDQFIMHGGRVIWLIDPMQMDMDSLRLSENTLATPLRVNLDDQLFTYGVRLNRNLLLDRSCAPISVVTGPKGNERTELLPFYFHPILIPTISHPITANVDPIYTEFISSIDTIAVPGVTKKVILTTSPYTRVLKSPVRVSLNIVSINPDFGNSNRAYEPVAVLLEGTFPSNFANRLPPEFYEDRTFGFREMSTFTRMLVVADGDLVRNQVSPEGNRFRELGFDPIVGRKIFGNKEFMVNSVNYLLGDDRLINVRSRTIILRKLDEEKILAQRDMWQVLNIGAPIALLVVAGLLQYAISRKRYAWKYTTPTQARPQKTTRKK
jgi:ABC-2 type transport system permease protein